MKGTMMMRELCAASMALAALSLSAATVSGVVDARVDANARTVANVVTLGTPSGGSQTSWNSAAYADGWQTVASEGATTNLLVLNACDLRGGRLSSSATWGAAKVSVLRNSVIVPSGVTLTIGLGAIVKLTPHAALEIESGGTLVLQGATLADIADDTVGGDTNCDGDASEPTGAADDFVVGEGLPSITRVSLLNGGEQEGLMRWYTAGQAYGTLPTLVKDGFRFDGWFTAAEGGTQVTASTAVPSVSSVLSVSSLYARWTAYTLGLDTTELEAPATAGSYSFGVTANTVWTVSRGGVSWLTLNTTSGSGDGTVSFSVAANRSTSERSATITVAGAGTTREFTVRQAGCEGCATPKITPADGTEFSGSARRCAITCATEGATIHYTLNGKDPDEDDPAYGGVSFNIFDTTVVKARAFKDGLAASAIATSRIVKKQTLADALDIPLWDVTNDADAPWTVDTDETHGTKASVRSGALDWDAGYEAETAIATAVSGAGTLTFWWKVSCEDDPSEYDNWDYLMVEVDGAEVTRIDGQTGWRQVSVRMGEGEHAIRWLYHKDDMDDEGMTGEDCGWVDAVSWTPSAVAGASGLSESWLQSVGAATGAGDKTAAEIAASDPDGDGLTVEEEYVAGTDPTDPESKFTAKIEIVDGEPQITWEPDLQGDEQPRSYTTLGKRNLDEADWTDQSTLTEEEKKEFHYFKVEVQMP